MCTILAPYWLPMCLHAPSPSVHRPTPSSWGTFIEPIWSICTNMDPNWSPICIHMHQNNNFKIKHIFEIFEYAYEHIPCVKLAYIAIYDEKSICSRFLGSGFCRILFPTYIPYRPCVGPSPLSPPPALTSTSATSEPLQGVTIH